MNNVSVLEAGVKSLRLHLWDNRMPLPSDMDAEIQALEQRLGKTRQIKQGMMQELLTGKTRLVQPLNKESQHG